MTKREMARLIERYVAPAFPDLQLVDDVMLVRYDGAPILRGFFFDRSQMHSRTFRVEAIAQPLYVPADDISLGIGATVGDYALGEGEGDEAVFARVVLDAGEVGTPWLARFADCELLAEHVHTDVARWRIDKTYLREARAYSLAYTGRTRAAKRALMRLRWFGGPIPEMKGRAAELYAALRSSPEEARALLDRWADDTKTALKLP